MQIAFSVMSFPISRHQKRSTAHPFFQKGWGTLVLSPHGELRKWYPLLMPLLQAEKSGESKAPPAGTLAGRYGFGASLTNTTNPLNVGKFTEYVPVDYAVYLLRRPCS